jgi:hypothetical protein
MADRASFNELFIVRHSGQEGVKKNKEILSKGCWKIMV